MKHPLLMLLATFVRGQPEGYFPLATRYTNRWGPGLRECYTANGAIAMAFGDEWAGTLAEAKTKCGATPGCTTLYDWGCDGSAWKYCKMVSRRRPATSCAHLAAPNPPPSPPLPPPSPLPNAPPASGAGTGVVIHLPPPPAPPGGFGESPCPGGELLSGRGPIDHCGSTYLQHDCERRYRVVAINSYQPCVFEIGACHHGETITCAPATPPPPTPHPPPFPSTPLPCPELEDVWGREPTYMMGSCSYYNYNQLECVRHYRLFNDGTRSACEYSSFSGLCVDTDARLACPPSPPGMPHPPSPPFVMVVHPDQASTQIVLADAFQTGSPGRRTYRPTQHLLQNGSPSLWGMS